MTYPPLFPCQQDAVKRLNASLPTYLAFDMGLGKSRTFIEAVKRRNAHRVLILCPSSARLVWRREIQHWDEGARISFVERPEALDTQARYTLITHGLLSQRDSQVVKALSACRSFQMTAIDEAHAFNASDSLRVKALKQVQDKLGFVVPLSGTPIRNHAGDLYNMLELCYPESLRVSGSVYMRRHAFEDRFCRVVNKVFNHRHVRVIEGSKNLEVLKARIAPFMVRVRKSEVLKELPPILWDQVAVPLYNDLKGTPHGTDMHELIRLAMTNSWLGQQIMEAAGDLANAAAMIARLGIDSRLMALRRLLGVAKLRGACEYLVDMLDTLAPDRKVLVFAVHADVIAALKAHLGEYDPAVIVGHTRPSEREAAVAKFLEQDSCRVFIGNIAAAGTALTLVGPTCKCSDVVFVESSWTAADNAQAACRVHRIGQKDGVVARMLTADATIEELIHNIIMRKSQEFSQLFDQKGEVQ